MLGLHNITYRTLHLCRESVENTSPAEKVCKNSGWPKSGTKSAQRFKGTRKRCRIFRMDQFLSPFQEEQE
jgi:hypothetical protein